MAHEITIKIWGNKSELIRNKKITIVDEYVTDDKIKIPFDDELLQRFQDDVEYELCIDKVSKVITRVYKDGKWLAINYVGGR